MIFFDKLVLNGMNDIRALGAAVSRHVNRAQELLTQDSRETQKTIKQLQQRLDALEPVSNALNALEERVGALEEAIINNGGEVNNGG